MSGLLDNAIYRISANNEVSVYMEQAGYTGHDVIHVGTQTRSGRSHVLLIGPSCTGLDSSRRLIWCANNDRAVMRLEPSGTRTVLSVGAADGRRFSGPNDIAVRRDDGVYLTDNDFGLRDAGESPDKQMPNGTLLGYLNLPIDGREPKRQICATNVAFGDSDGMSLYITACDDVYRIRLQVAGL